MRFDYRFLAYDDKPRRKYTQTGVGIPMDFPRRASHYKRGSRARPLERERELISWLCRNLDIDTRVIISASIPPV